MEPNSEDKQIISRRLDIAKEICDRLDSSLKDQKRPFRESHLLELKRLHVQFLQAISDYSTALELDELDDQPIDGDSMHELEFLDKKAERFRTEMIKLASNSSPSMRIFSTPPPPPNPYSIQLSEDLFKPNRKASSSRLKFGVPPNLKIYGYRFWDMFEQLDLFSSRSIRDSLKDLFLYVSPIYPAGPDSVADVHQDCTQRLEQNIKELNKPPEKRSMAVLFSNLTYIQRLLKNDSTSQRYLGPDLEAKLLEHFDSHGADYAASVCSQIPEQAFFSKERYPAHHAKLAILLCEAIFYLEGLNTPLDPEVERLKDMAKKLVDKKMIYDYSTLLVFLSVPYAHNKKYFGSGPNSIEVQLDNYIAGRLSSHSIEKLRKRIELALFFSSRSPTIAYLLQQALIEHEQELNSYSSVLANQIEDELTQDLDHVGWDRLKQHLSKLKLLNHILPSTNEVILGVCKKTIQIKLEHLLTRTELEPSLNPNQLEFVRFLESFLLSKEREGFLSLAGGYDDEDTEKLRGQLAIIFDRIDDSI